MSWQKNKTDSSPFSQEEAEVNLAWRNAKSPPRSATLEVAESMYKTNRIEVESIALIILSAQFENMRG